MCKAERADHRPRPARRAGGSAAPPQTATTVTSRPTRRHPRYLADYSDTPSRAADAHPRSAPKGGAGRSNPAARDVEAPLEPPLDAEAVAKAQK